MQHTDTWTQEEIERLFEIALNNSQVRYILGDSDVKMFYSKLLRNGENFSENAIKVKNTMENRE